MNRINSLTHEKAEDQREIIDTILEGNRRIVETIKSIRDISQGKEPNAYQPLVRQNYIEKHKESIEMQKPLPPRSTVFQTHQNENILNVIYQDITVLRSKIEKYSELGICGKKELEEFENDLYAIQTKLYNSVNK